MWTRSLLKRFTNGILVFAASETTRGTYKFVKIIVSYVHSVSRIYKMQHISEWLHLIFAVRQYYQEVFFFLFVAASWWCQYYHLYIATQYHEQSTMKVALELSTRKYIFIKEYFHLTRRLGVEKPYSEYKTLSFDYAFSIGRTYNNEHLAKRNSGMVLAEILFGKIWIFVKNETLILSFYI